MTLGDWTLWTICLAPMAVIVSAMFLSGFGLRKFLQMVRNAVSVDINRRHYAAKLFGEWLTKDFRVSWRQMDWWQDPNFNAYLDRFGERDGMNTHRKWTLWQMLRLTVAVPGDTAECGVYEGASSWLICAANRNNPHHRRTHHLFDSFEGLSEPADDDGKHWTKGILSAGEDKVLANLLPFADMLKFHRGWIPDRFKDVSDKRFSFVHVDVDLAQPTLDSLEFFYDRLSPGGILLCDDYACGTCPGATSVIDKFLANKPEKMVSLDSGGGFFIKGAVTALPLSPIETETLMEYCPNCKAA